MMKKKKKKKKKKRMKKKKKTETMKEKDFGLLVAFWFGTFAMLFRTTRCVCYENAGWYVVIKVYRFTVLENWRFL